jgi:hypothetical protein
VIPIRLRVRCPCMASPGAPRMRRTLSLPAGPRAGRPWPVRACGQVVHWDDQRSASPDARVGSERAGVAVAKTLRDDDPSRRRRPHRQTGHPSDHRLPSRYRCRSHGRAVTGAHGMEPGAAADAVPLLRSCCDLRTHMASSQPYASLIRTSERPDSARPLTGARCRHRPPGSAPCDRPERRRELRQPRRPDPRARAPTRADPAAGG